MTAQTSLLDFLVTPDMTEADHRVWSALRSSHEGAENAIQVPTLAELVRMSPRNVQKIVRRLVVVFGKPIGTSMREPFGNFVAVTAAEREQVAALHRARALSELEVAAKIEGISREEYARKHQAEFFGDAA